MIWYARRGGLKHGCSICEVYAQEQEQDDVEGFPCGSHFCSALRFPFVPTVNPLYRTKMESVEWAIRLFFFLLLG